MDKPELEIEDSPILSLSDYIKINSRKISVKDINILRLQILDYFNYAKKNSLEKWVEFDYRKLFFDVAKKKLIFPGKTRPLDSKTDIDFEYARFETFLNEHKLSFVKPVLNFYSDVENRQLMSAFHKQISNIAAYPCVNKIYFLNAESKQKLGTYGVPLVHSNWVMLGSEFNLLIEIDERHRIPSTWDYKLYWKECSSFYYHLGNINHPIESPYIEHYNNISFYHHMLEAYLFLPSKGDRDVMNGYLKKFKARLLYQKKLTLVPTSDLLKTFIEKQYDLQVDDVETLNPSSFNEVYKIMTPNQNYVIKIMNRDDFTPSSNQTSGLHAQYEANIYQAISSDNISVVTPIPAIDSDIIHEFDGRPCMLFPLIQDNDSSNELTIEAAAMALASIHNKLFLIDAPTELYRFNEYAEYWIEQYSLLHMKYTQNKKHLKQLESMLPDIIQAKQIILKSQKLPYLHVHGNINPNSFLYVKSTPLLFDFQLSHYGPRLEDIAEGALEFAWHDSMFEQELIDNFILFYDEKNPLTEEEKKLLPVMLFLQATVKLARLFRIDNIFGGKVDKERINALLKFTHAKRKIIKNRVY